MTSNQDILNELPLWPALRVPESLRLFHAAMDRAREDEREKMSAGTNEVAPCNGGDFLTLDKLRAMVEPILNDICIVFNQDVGRLVGVAEDDQDFYYVVDRIHKDRRMQCSAVGPVFSLKGCIPDVRYAAMDRLHEVNGCPAVEQMIVMGNPAASAARIAIEKGDY